MEKQTEILVIGAGLAGSIAAITAADRGCKVVLVTKTPDLIGGNTPYAQGGIIYSGLKDNKNELKTDIMTAGAGHCWEVAVDQLVDEGGELIEEVLFKRCGVDFDKDNLGKLNLTEEGGHSAARIIHSKDQTGAATAAATLPAD